MTDEESTRYREAKDYSAIQSETILKQKEEISKLKIRAERAEALLVIVADREREKQ